MALVIAAACGGGGGNSAGGHSGPARQLEPAALSAEEDHGLAECVVALETLPSVDATSRLSYLVQGCAAAGPGFAELSGPDAAQKARALAEKTDFLCDRQAALPDGPTMIESVLALCGADYYGLRPGQEWLMSIEWYVVQRVGRYLGKMAARADPAMVQRIDSATRPARFFIASPARMPGLYQLPAASNVDLDQARAYVIVTRDQIRLARRPEVQLTLAGAELIADDYTFPGKLVAAPELAKRIGELLPESSAGPDDQADGPESRPGLDEGKPGSPSPEPASGPPAADDQETDPQLARQQAIERARKAGIAGLPQGASNESLLDEQVLRAAPVIIAGADTPAARVSEVLDSMGGGPVHLAARMTQHPHLVNLDVGLRLWSGTEPLALIIEPAGSATRLRSATRNLDIPNLNGAPDSAAIGAQIAELDLARPGAIGISTRAGSTADLIAIADGARTGGARKLVLVADSTGARLVEAAATRPEVQLGAAAATGDLDKQIIRRYVRRALPKIKYCYEKQLLQHLDLKGTVVTNFTIDAHGRVIEARASGLDPAVSACVTDVIRSIEFPARVGRGRVEVRYPFNFHTAP